MGNFEKALKKVLQWEGGYVNHPNDPGGATNKGITLKTYQYHFGKDKTVEDLKNITLEEVSYIYREGYWNKIKGDDIANQSIAELLFDFSVNSGAKTAVRKLQHILCVDADGILGDITLKALNDYPSQKELFKHIWTVRKKYYEYISKKNPDMKVFLEGWMNRLKSYQFE